MKTLFQEAFCILVLANLILGYSISQENSNDNQVDNRLLSEKINCPRDCVCKSKKEFISNIAKCNRLEIGTQKFGNNFTDLIIDGSKNVKLTDNIFTKLGLNKVTNVQIVNSYITKVSPLAFANLNELFSVDLSGNKIESFDPDTFYTNKFLYLLSLKNNPLKFSSTSFLNSPTLQELELSNCGITSIPAIAFSGLSNINMINLSGNKLKELDPELFSLLDNLEEVNLSNNELKTIPHDMFFDNSGFNTLILDNNPITTLDGLRFSDLVTITAQNAKIKKISNSTFKDMFFLDSIVLSGNEIEEIETDAFTKLTDLNLLDLSNNKLQSLSDQLFRLNYNLDVLKIANNTLLKKLPDEGFVYTSEPFSLFMFDASGCSLEIISNNTFQTMTTLTQLDLSNNRITDIGSSLSFLKDLISFNIKNNLIERLDKFTFANNKKLKHLDLSGNPIVTISVYFFENNPSLSTLDVSNCQLYQLWEDTTPNYLKELNVLNASHNQIVVIHPDEIKMTKKLVTLDISNNPLQCNKEFEKLMIFLGKSKISTVKKDTKIANLNLFNAKMKNENSNWQLLSKQICDLKVIPSISSSKDSLKEGTKKSTESDGIIDDDDKEYDADDDEDDDAEDIDDDDDDDIKDDDYYDEPDDKSEEIITYKKLDNTIDIENGKTILETTHKEIDVKKIEKDGIEEVKYTKEVDLGSKLNDCPDIDNIPIKSDEETFNQMIERVRLEGSTTSTSSYFKIFNDEDIVLHIVFMTLIVVVLALSLIYLRKLRINRLRRGNAIATVSGGYNRKKRDCGLVYQQLSEDLTGPKTPILKKHNLISNMIPEAHNLFQKDKVVPEAV